MLSLYRGRVHPSGTATVGAVPPAKKTASEKRYEDVARRLGRKISDYSDGTSTESGISRVFRAGIMTVTQAFEALSSLGLSSLSISRKTAGTPILSLGEIGRNSPTPASGGDKPIKRYGANGITSFGRLRVKDGAAIMQREYGKSSLAFVTVTLPTMNSEDLEKICLSWGEFTNRITEEIKRELHRCNSPVDIVHCTEIQEHRYEKYGVVAPHLHLIWYAYKDGNLPQTERTKKEYAITAHWLRELVQRKLAYITGVKNIAVGASVDIQRVKKDAVAYLGKYMSKGSKISQSVIKDGKGSLLPKRWWGMSDELRDKVRKSIITIESNAASNLFYEWDKLQKFGFIKYANFVMIDVFSDGNNVNERAVDAATGEVKSMTSLCENDSHTSAFVKKCYGASMQLTKKAVFSMPYFVRVLDICNKLSNADMAMLQECLHKISDSDSLGMMCDIVDEMSRQILIGDDQHLTSDDLCFSY